MKRVGRHNHPDVTYWACPCGDAKVLIRGDQFYTLVAFGQEAETEDLGFLLSATDLEIAEEMVEQHEKRHLGGVA